MNDLVFRLAASIAAEDNGRFPNNASTSAAAAAIIPAEEDGSEEEEMILVSLFYVVYGLLPFVFTKS